MATGKADKLRSGFCLALVICGFFLARPAQGELSGYLEYGYMMTDAESTDRTTGATSSKSSSLSQRYSLAASRNLYPLLRIAAGGTFDLNRTETESSGITTTANSNRLNSYADVSLGNQLIAAGFGYSQRTERPARTASEVYSGRLNWRPEGLPTLSIVGSRLLAYDFDRLSNDTVNDALTVSSTFTPFKGLDLAYSGQLTSGENRINFTRNESSSHSLRAGYGTSFWDSRVSVQSNYNITLRELKNEKLPLFVAPSEGRGTLKFIQPITNPLILSFTNLQPLELSALPLLNLRTTDTKLITAKFDLSRGNLAPTAIRLTVDAATADEINKPSNGLKASLESYFADPTRVTWYASSDGNSWTQIGPFAPRYGVFFTPTNDRYEAFEFIISSGGRPFIAVVLKQYADPAVIAMPASVRISQFLPFAEPLPGSAFRTETTSGAFDLATRVMILKDPNLSYDFSLRLTHDKRSGSDLLINHSIVNGLSLTHQMSETLSTFAHANREDSDTAGKKRNSTGWGGGFNYTPLRTLSLMTTYSGRTETADGLTGTSHAISMINSAELYRGVILGISAAASTQTRQETVGETSSDVLGGTAGLTLQPHRAVTLTAGFSESHQWITGAGRPRRVTYNRSADTGIGFNPLQGVYLSASLSYSLQSENPSQTTMNFGGSWAPFRDGALQLTVSYREGSTSFGERDRSFVQGLRWNIRPGTYLDVSHQMQWTENSSTGTSGASDGYLANLRIAL